MNVNEKNDCCSWRLFSCFTHQRNWHKNDKSYLIYRYEQNFNSWMIKLTKTNGYFCIISQVIFNSSTLKYKIQAKNIYWHFFNFQKSLLRNRATYYVFTTQTNLYLDKLICTTPRLILREIQHCSFEPGQK